MLCRCHFLTSRSKQFFLFIFFFSLRWSWEFFFQTVFWLCTYILFRLCTWIWYTYVVRFSSFFFCYFYLSWFSFISFGIRFEYLFFFIFDAISIHFEWILWKIAESAEYNQQPSTVVLVYFFFLVLLLKFSSIQFECENSVVRYMSLCIVHIRLHRNRRYSKRKKKTKQQQLKLKKRINLLVYVMLFWPFWSIISVKIGSVSFSSTFFFFFAWDVPVSEWVRCVCLKYLLIEKDHFNLS